MKYISEEELNRIRTNANIVDIISSYGIKLTKTGKDNYLCLCPFHDDHNPNMIVSEKKQIYKCFGGCGAGGNVFKFVQDIENISFVEAVKIVAEKSGQSFNFDVSGYKMENNKFKDEYKLMDLSLKFFQNNLASADGVKAIEYLNGRGINDEIISTFSIGLATSENSLKAFFEKKDVDLELAYNLGLLNKVGINYYDVYSDRIMIPIYNSQGYLCGYTGRCYLKDEKNKYINTKETIIYKKSEILFNYYNAKEEINKLKEIVLVEGNMDAISLSVQGIKNVCALMGVVLSNFQIELIKKTKAKIVLMLDSDNAGATATMKVGDVLYQRGLNVNVVRLSGSKDPDEYIRKNGLEALRENIKNAKKYIDFKIDALKQNYNLSSVEELTNYVKEIMNFVDGTSAIEKEVIINKLSGEYNLDKNILLKMVSDTKSVEKVSIPEKSTPVIKTIYDLASSQLIYAMLLHKEYYQIYMNELGYLKNVSQRETVSLIGEYEEKYFDIDIAGFMDYVIKYPSVSDYINKILTDNNAEDIDEKEFIKILKRVTKCIDMDDLKSLKQKIFIEQDENEKMKLLERFLKIKKEVEKNEGNKNI